MKLPRPFRFSLPFFALGFFLSSSTAWAWGCKGHQTVALIAEKHLTPEARQLMDKLLSENPVDPQVRRYCGNTSRDPLVDASTWPDDVRNDLKNGPWHYINIPRGASQGSIEQYCSEQGCITRAIAEQWHLLKDKDAASHKRADAVRYLIHFVGDLHMPLHAASNNDEGGTCVPVRYFRRQPHQVNNSFVPNLHALWDTAIPERDMQGAEPPEYSDFLDHMFSADFDKWQKAGIHIEDWAWESHDLANTIAYGELAPAVPIEQPVPVHSCSDANNVGARLLRFHFYVGESYHEIAATVVEERLAQAGVRLAMILDDAAQSAAK